MFGFGRLGSYNYFAHVQRELELRFAAAGHELVPHVIEDLPTASVRRRATRFPEVRTFLTAIQDDQGSMLSMCSVTSETIAIRIPSRRSSATAIG